MTVNDKEKEKGNLLISVVGGGHVSACTCVIIHIASLKC